jgi:hypothetical protein
LVMHDLDGNCARQDRIVALVNSAHTPFSQQTIDSVLADIAANQWVHVRRKTS